METLNRHSIVSRATDTLDTNVDEELIIVHFESNAYYGLDVIGRHIWELLATPRKVQDLCTELCSHYNVSAEQCEADVLLFLRELAQDNVVHSPAT